MDIRQCARILPGLTLLGSILIQSNEVLSQGVVSGVHQTNIADGARAAGGSMRANGVDFGLGGTNEPSIAVNPLNSQNIAYASLFSSRVSTNGGTSWTASVGAPVPAGYGNDGDSTLAFDSQGRLFWQYLGFINNRGELVISQLNPTSGAIIAGPFLITTSAAAGSGDNDKGWVAADRFAASPFHDRLYVAWTDFGTSPVTVLFSYSTNQGGSWSSPIPLSAPSDGGFAWPTHLAVAPNGDVYVSYHDGGASGTTGRVWVLRSTNGGVSFSQKTLAFAPGQADTTYNVQGSGGTIPLTQFWLQGSGQAWVVPDPQITGNVYVVASDDPDNVHGSGDESNIYIARSTNNGVSWGAPIRVDHGPGTSFQVMPTTAMDDQSGCIAVMWYDNRLGNLNDSGRYLLDVYYSISHDRGMTWDPDVQINDVHFDPDRGAPVRFPGPPPTTRIGEYIGVAMGGDHVYGVWCGNTASGQQTIFDSAVAGCGDCNHNGVSDIQDIADGTSQDCNHDLLPDECESGHEDCNNNGTLDQCEAAFTDCNFNGHLDTCDIASGSSRDCNANGIPDECESSCQSASGSCAPTSTNATPNNYCQGTQSQVTLSASGGFGTQIQWFSDSCAGPAIGTGGSITIAAPTSTRTFYARWASPCGSSACAQVIVNVYTPGTVTQQPQPAAACVGGSVSFTTAVSSNPPPLSYQWRKNFVPLIGDAHISGQDSPTLTINPVGGADSASYDCRILTVCNTLATNAVQLSIASAAPSFVVQPQGYDTCAGQPLDLYAVASGNPAPSYQWRHDGQDIPGAHSPSYDVNVTTAQDSGSYVLVATTACFQTLSDPAVVNFFATATGDGNLDGHLNGKDIPGFIDAMLNWDGVTYTGAYCAYDMNGDVYVDDLDVPGFVSAILIGN